MGHTLWGSCLGGRGRQGEALNNRVVLSLQLPPCMMFLRVASVHPNNLHAWHVCSTHITHAGRLAAAAAALVQLLGGILDVNASYVCVVDELGLSQSFFDFLTLDHPNNNVHNIRLCRQLVLSGCISTQQLLQLRATDKVSWDGACSNVVPAGLPGRRLLGAEPLGSGAGAACPRHV